MIIAKWSGEYPCRCCGEWSLFIRGMNYSHMIPENLRTSHMNTAGTDEEWWFDDNMCEQFGNYEDGLEFEEWVAENPWVHDLPASLFDIYLAFQAEDFRPGECGGCI